MEEPSVVKVGLLYSNFGLHYHDSANLQKKKLYSYKVVEEPSVVKVGLLYSNFGLHYHDSANLQKKFIFLQGSGRIFSSQGGSTIQ